MALSIPRFNCTSRSNPAADQPDANTAASNSHVETTGAPSSSQQRAPLPDSGGRNLARRLMNKLKRVQESSPYRAPSTGSVSQPGEALPPVHERINSEGTRQSSPLDEENIPSRPSTEPVRNASVAPQVPIEAPPSRRTSIAHTSDGSQAIVQNQPHSRADPETAPITAGDHPGTAVASSHRLSMERPSARTKTTLSDLPIEVQLNILSMLPFADRRRYRLIARFANAAGKLTFPNIRVSSTADLKAALKTHQENQIRTLVFSGSGFKSTHLRNKELGGLMRQKLGCLDSLYFVDCKLTMNDVATILTEHIPNPGQIKRLIASGDSVLHTLNPDNINAALRDLSGLTHLNMRLSNPHQAIGYLYLSGAFSELNNLTHLDVSEYGDSNTANNANCLNDEKLAAVLRNKSNLALLNVSGCGTLSLHGIGNALSGTPNIKSLIMADLSTAVELDNQGQNANILSGVLTKAPGLIQLDISNMKSLTCRKLHDALLHVPGLRQLNLSGCEGLMQADFHLLVDALRILNLTEIKLSDLGFNFDNEKLNGLLQAVGIELEHLELSSSSSPNQINSNGLIEALANTPNVRHLDISSSYFIDDLKLPQLVDLRSLNASNMHALESLDLNDVPNLESLSLSGLTSEFNMSTFQATLAPVRRTLTHLSLSSIAELVDEHLMDLSSFERLRYLDLSDNDHITDAVLDMSRLPPNLEYLSIKGCANFTDAAVERLPRTIQIVQY